MVVILSQLSRCFLRGLATEAERSQAVGDAIGQRHILLIIDDAWQREAADDWLRCGGPNCCHLLTTRYKDIARDFAGMKGVVSVPVLKHDPNSEDNPAYEFLALKASRHRSWNCQKGKGPFRGCVRTYCTLKGAAYASLSLG